MASDFPNSGKPEKAPVAYDPLECLILWCVVLDGDEAEQQLKPLGVDHAEIERLKRENPELLERMRKLQICGRLLTAGKLAMLLRARLGEELMRTRDAKGIALITAAMGKMALWMLAQPGTGTISGPPERPPRYSEEPFGPGSLPRIISRPGEGARHRR